MAIITIVGSGMMGSALAFPARENGHEVRLVGTHLDKDIINECLKTNKHPKFDRAFPNGVKFYQLEELELALTGANVVIGGVSSFGVQWFADEILPVIPESAIVLTVTKGLMNTPDGKLLKVVESRVCDDEKTVKCIPGTVLSVGEDIKVACGKGILSLKVVVPEGKGRMSAADFVRGRKIAEGDILS